MTKARVNGVQLEFDEAGGGPRTLLLIHGHPFDRSMWRPQLEWAARLGWRVIAPDLRGYGASDPAGEKTTLDVFARDLQALLDHLGVCRAVIAGTALSRGPHILGEQFTAADILVSSPYQWLRNFGPSSPLIDDWLARLAGRRAAIRAAARDKIPQAERAPPLPPVN